MRAYSAAMILWTKLYELEKEAGRADRMFTCSMCINLSNYALILAESLSNLAFSGVGNDSVLFLLCYNDTVSLLFSFIRSKGKSKEK